METRRKSYHSIRALNDSVFWDGVKNVCKRRLSSEEGNGEILEEADKKKSMSSAIFKKKVPLSGWHQVPL